MEREDGTVARVHGSRVPGEKDVEALDAVMGAAVAHMDRIDSVHERVACPKCSAPVGKRCRKLPRGYFSIDLDDPALMCKSPHQERLSADGIYLR